MKTAFGIFLLGLLLLLFENSFSQIRTFCFKGVVASIAGPQYITENINLNDSIYGIMKFSLAVNDTNTLPQFGDYINTSDSAGLEVQINNLVIRSGSNFYSDLWIQNNWPNNTDALAFSTLGANIPISNSLGDDRSFELRFVDSTGWALQNTDIPNYIDLHNWQQHFLNIFGQNYQHTIRAQILATITNIDTSCLFPLTVQNHYARNPIKIYPNPSNGNFIIETNFETNTDNSTLDIFDLQGKHLLRQNLFRKSKIDATFLNEGIYNLIIKSSEGIINNKLVVIK